VRTLASELHDGARLFFSIALGIGAGALLRLMLGRSDHGWRVAAVIAIGLAVTVGAGTLMHAYP